LGSVVPPALAWPIVAGAVVPDVPVWVLYLRERARGTPDETIWSVHYQKPFWLNLIHGLHSIPLALAGLAACLALSAPAGAAFFASMALHSAADLPVHAYDAHRHFLPLSHWRFISPLSYWDERFHGRAVAGAEMALVIAASLVVLGRYPLPSVAAVLACVDGWYAYHYWRSFLRRKVPKST